MLLRRAFFYWQFVAALVLPLWLFVGWGVSSGSGWSFVGLLFVAPVLFATMLVVTVLIYLRGSVRRTNAVSWWDVAVLGAWHATIIAFGFFTPVSSAFAVLGVVLALASFWLAVWQLIEETRRRTAEVLSEFERMATPPTAASRRPIDGETIVVRESHDGAR
jgi:hypothetical protein